MTLRLKGNFNARIGKYCFCREYVCSITLLDNVWQKLNSFGPLPIAFCI